MTDPTLPKGFVLEEDDLPEGFVLESGKFPGPTQSRPVVGAKETEEELARPLTGMGIVGEFPRFVKEALRGTEGQPARQKAIIKAFLKNLPNVSTTPHGLQKLATSLQETSDENLASARFPFLKQVAPEKFPVGKTGASLRESLKTEKTLTRPSIYEDFLKSITPNLAGLAEGFTKPILGSPTSGELPESAVTRFPFLRQTHPRLAPKIAPGESLKESLGGVPGGTVGKGLKGRARATGELVRGMIMFPYDMAKSFVEDPDAFIREQAGGLPALAVFSPILHAAGKIVKAGKVVPGPMKERASVDLAAKMSEFDKKRAEFAGSKVNPEEGLKIREAMAAKPVEAPPPSGPRMAKEAVLSSDKMMEMIQDALKNKQPLTPLQRSFLAAQNMLTEVPPGVGGPEPPPSLRRKIPKGLTEVPENSVEAQARLEAIRRGQPIEPTEVIPPGVSTLADERGTIENVADLALRPGETLDQLKARVDAENAKLAGSEPALLPKPKRPRAPKKVAEVARPIFQPRANPDGSLVLDEFPGTDKFNRPVTTRVEFDPKIGKVRLAGEWGDETGGPMTMTLDEAKKLSEATKYQGLKDALLRIPESAAPKGWLGKLKAGLSIEQVGDEVFYRGTAEGKPSTPSKVKWPLGRGIFATTDFEAAKKYGKNVQEVRLKKGSRVIDMDEPVRDSIEWHRVINFADETGNLPNGAKETLLKMIKNREVGNGIHGDIPGMVVHNFIKDTEAVYDAAGVAAIKHTNAGRRTKDILIRDESAIEPQKSTEQIFDDLSRATAGNKDNIWSMIGGKTPEEAAPALRELAVMKREEIIKRIEEAKKRLAGGKKGPPQPGMSIKYVGDKGEPVSSRGEPLNPVDVLKETAGGFAGNKPEPERRVYSLARQAEATAIRQGYVNTFGELPTYEVKKKVAQLERSIDFMDKDWEGAKRVAFGVDEPPEGIDASTMWQAVKTRAVRMGEADTIRKLAMESPVMLEKSKTAGQFISNFDYLDKLADDPVKAIRETADIRRKKAEQTGRTIAPETLRTLRERAEDLERQVVAAEPADRIDSLINKRPQGKVAREGKKYSSQDLNEKIWARLSKGENLGDVLGLVNKLALSFVEDGITNRSALVAKVHEVLVKYFPQLKITDTRDILSGYGEYTPPTVDAAKIILGDNKAQLQKVAQIEALQEGRNPLKTGRGRIPPSVEARKLQSEVNALMKKNNIPAENPEMELKTWVDRTKGRLVNEFQKYITKLQEGDFATKEEIPSPSSPEIARLREARDLAKNAYQAAQKVAGKITDAEVQELTRLSQEMLAAKDAMDNGGSRLDFGWARVRYIKYVDSLQRGRGNLLDVVKDEAARLKTDFGTKYPLTAAMDTTKRAYSTISNVLVSIVSTLDNSLWGRQGMATLKTHPVIWGKNFAKSFSDAVNTMRNKHGYEQVRDAVLADAFSRENYRDYVDYKLLVEHEEQFPTSLVGKIPLAGRLFKASENAFTNGAMRLRMDLYDLYKKQAELARKRDPQNGPDVNSKAWKKATAEMVGSMTGRGHGKFGDNSLARTLLWAPKMVQANWNFLTAHTFGKGLEDPWVRKQATINAGKNVLATAGVLAIANALGADIDLNPTSPNFLKIKVGNTRIDVMGGGGAILTAISRFVSLGVKQIQDPSLRKGLSTLEDLGYDFLANKTKPTVRPFADFMRNHDYKGDPIVWENYFADLATPISINNFIKLFHGPDKDGSLEATLGAIADFFGFNASTYAPRPTKTKGVPKW